MHLQGRTKVLLTISLMIISSVITIQEEGSAGSRAPSNVMTDVHVNVTYPDGGLASGIYVKVHRDGYNFNWYRAESGYTNSSGQTRVYISSYNLGPCHLTVYNNSKSSFTSTEIYIWPDERPYFDIVLTPALPYANSISGRVLNRSSGLPTARPTSIGASGTDDTGLSFNVFSTTDTDGSFELMVPNSTGPISINVNVLNSSEKYLHHGADMFLEKGVDSYSLDIHLTPVVKVEIPVSLRFLHGSSGQPVRDIILNRYTGTRVDNDHAYTEEWPYTGTDGDGWMNLTLGHGEYILSSFYDLTIGAGSVLGFDIPLIVNTTPLEKDIEIPLPDEFREVTLQVKDSDGGAPLPGTGSDFSYRVVRDGLAVSISSSYLETNSTGQVTFGIIPDEKVEVQLSLPGYASRTHTILPGPASSPVFHQIEMMPSQSILPPRANISLLVKDEKSGIPLPDVSIFGEGTYNGESVSFYGITDRDGYYNGTIYAGTYEVKLTASIGEKEIDGFVVAGDRNTSIVVEIQRKYFEEPRSEVEFRLVDGSGSFLGSEPVRVYSLDLATSLDLISDLNGVVKANLRPGIYFLETPDHFPSSSIYRQHYIVPKWTAIEIEGGGSYGDIILYPATALEEINGFVRDRETGRVIPFQKVKASSYHFLPGEASRNEIIEEPYPDSEKVLLFQEVSGSGENGFYRFWGREMVEVECYVEGYFPYRETIDLSSRAVHHHDIIVERVPEISTWVNGTLVDGSGSPVSGTVKIFDGERRDYLIGRYDTEADGKFSIRTYTGDLLVEFYNLTLKGEIIIDVRSQGIDDLKLELIAMSGISGTVLNDKDELLTGIEVILLEMTGNTTVVGADFTDDMGKFLFQVEPGVYALSILGLEGFDDYRSDNIIATGWNDIDLMITLQNRTRAVELNGKVTGNGGMHDGIGIPDCEVILTGKTLEIMVTARTNSTGVFDFDSVPYNNYTITVKPPGEILELPEFYRSGYSVNTTEEFRLSEYRLEVSIQLKHVEYTPPGYFNIIGYSPEGLNISLDEPLRFWFSHPVDETTFMSAFSIWPDVGNLSFRFNRSGTALAIFHDPFEPNTAYNVEIGPLVLSKSGLLIKYDTGAFDWSFTTGNSGGRWGLYSSVITIGYERSWEVAVTGGPGQEVFIVIHGVGSFELEEIPVNDIHSLYHVLIDGEKFEWNTTYWFHYSDSEGGEDMAVDLSGFRHMPAEGSGPGEVWRISSSSVRILDNGDWKVSVAGNPGLDVYIVIPGVDSFLLAETTNGTYSITILASNFEGGKEYIYYFSDSPGGDDLAEEFGGSLVAKEIEANDDGDGEGRGILWILLLIIAVLLIAAALIMVFVAVRKKGEGEEIMDWGEE